MRISHRAFAAWLAGALMVILLAFLADAPVHAWIAARDALAGKHAAGAISHFGDWLWVAGSGLLASGICRLLGRRSWARLFFLMLAACALAGLAASTLRFISGRTRPNAHDVAQGWYGMRPENRWIGHQNRYHSFPSAHTAVIAAFFAPPFLWARRRRPELASWAAAAALAPALVMAWARVWLDVHHPSDVVIAIFLGWGCAVVVCRWEAGFWAEGQPRSLRLQDE